MHRLPWHRVEWERGIPSLSSAAPAVDYPVRHIRDLRGAVAGCQIKFRARRKADVADVDSPA
jgi:hypothetical protein